MATLTRGQNVIVRDFAPEDYLAIGAAAYQGPGAWRPNLDRLARQYLREGPAFTAWWQGEILACAGLLMPWPGFARAWAVLSPAGRQHPLMVHRATRRFLATLIRVHALRRVEAYALDDRPADGAWLQALGFTLEARCPAWGPAGETALLWARLP